MSAKNIPFKNMQEATGREQKVVLVALIRKQYAKILSWIDPHSDKGQRGIPNEYEPRVDDDGAVLYEVPVPYARRLLAGERLKYMLVEPGLIRVPMGTGGGGVKQAMVSKKVKKVVDDKVVRSKLGVPVWVYPEDQEG